MNEFKTFLYENKEIRTIQLNGETWWVLKDVCEVLSLSNPSMIADRLDDDERAKFDLGRQGETNIINESGLYNVILRSDKPEAKKFKRWVTHDVLPSIRKQGAYISTSYPPKSTSVGEVASIIKELRLIMKEQQSPPTQIAEMAQGICNQFGIHIPECFIHYSPWEQQTFLMLKIN